MSISQGYEAAAPGAKTEAELEDVNAFVFISSFLYQQFNFIVIDKKTPLLLGESFTSHVDR